MRALLLLNEKAGSVKAAGPEAEPEALCRALTAAGVDTRPAPRHSDDLAECFKAAIAERPEVIFVGGGDGTVSSAAGFLADTGIALGVLPLGTLNHFAKDLGLPLTLAEAVAALGTGVIRSVDVAEVNGRVFINNCSLGPYAEAVRHRDTLQRQKGHGKWLAMTIASFAVFRQLRRFFLKIEQPSGTIELRTPLLVVANNEYRGRVLATNLRERLDEGKLWLYSTRAHRHGAILRLVWQTLLHRLDSADGLDARSATEATISSLQGDLPIATDGEVLTIKPPLKFRIRPGALRVLVPARPPAS